MELEEIADTVLPEEEPRTGACSRGTEDKTKELKIAHFSV